MKMAIRKNIHNMSQGPPNPGYMAWMYLQLPLRQWGAGNVYLLVFSSWKVNIAENFIAVTGIVTF